jgi:hypothetical protein
MNRQSINRQVLFVSAVALALLLRAGTLSGQEMSAVAKASIESLEKEHHPKLKERQSKIEATRKTVSSKECDDYIGAVNAAIAVWNKIPESEHKQSKIAEVGKELDAYIAFAREAEKLFKERREEEKKTEGANEALFAEWRKDGEKYEKAVRTLLNTSDFTTRYNLNIGGADNRYEIDETTFPQLMKETDEAEKMMKEKYASLRDVNDSRYRDYLLYKPSIWREVLAERKKIAGTALAAKISDQMSGVMSNINVQLLLEEKGQLYLERSEQEARIAEFKKTVQPKLQALGVSEADMGFDKITEKINAYWKTDDSLAPTIQFPEDGKYKDASAEAAMAEWVKKVHKGKAKILKTAMKYDDWVIEKNKLGIPLKREKSGYVLYSLPNSKWNVLEKMQVREDYSGAGKYSKPKGLPGGLTLRRFFYTAAKK